ncbi:MBL fold metallo-hydrolase [Coprobacter sp.]
MKNPAVKFWCMIVGIVIGIIIVLGGALTVFLNQPRFGRLPRSGERLERIKCSPHYQNGKFRNLHPTALMTSNKSKLWGILTFLFAGRDGLLPDIQIPVIKTDLKVLIQDSSDIMVWFGHSSYFLQLSGKHILVDPVFCMAAPVSFVNKPFKGTDIYKPEDVPDIDYLIITHDHWDHLDYETIKQLKNRIRKVVCPLGVGEHFEYWGFDREKLVELDWQEESVLDNGFVIHCLPARHFSGRGLTSNRTLWASFLIETPSRKVFMGGDGGYDTHFAEVGKQYPGIDLAVLENGQYNEDWKYIHTMPVYLGQIAKDLKAEQIVTVHHSKYALARHRWDEPLKNEINMVKEDSLNLIVPVIGQVVRLDHVEEK